jgi:hypothetical protein
LALFAKEFLGNLKKPHREILLTQAGFLMPANRLIN